MIGFTILGAIVGLILGYIGMGIALKTLAPASVNAAIVVPWAGLVLGILSGAIYGLARKIN